MHYGSDGLPVYNTDNDADISLLLAKSPDLGRSGIRPRQTVYGSAEAVAAGLMPVEEVPDVLIAPGDYGDALKVAHETKSMPMYFTYQWRPQGTRYSQDKLGIAGPSERHGHDDDDPCTQRVSRLQLLLPSVDGLSWSDWANSGNYLESLSKERASRASVRQRLGGR